MFNCIENLSKFVDERNKIKKKIAVEYSGIFLNTLISCKPSNF